MKYRAITFILILFMICLYGCMAEEPTQSTGRITPTVAKPDDTPHDTSEDTLQTSAGNTEEDYTLSIPGDFFTKEEAAAAQVFSEAAASAVWQYGKELDWVDENGLANSVITPQQLALSQATYKQTLIYWCWENTLDDIGTKKLEDEEKEAYYAQILFPGVKESELPETDEFSGWSLGVNALVKVDAAQAIFSSASVDGKVGYVIVRILYENKNGEFEDFYRVEWKKKDSSGGNNPFQYQLIGVRPMGKFPLGGQPQEDFSKKYLDSVSAKAFEKLGLTHSVGSLDAAWGAENIFLLKTIFPQGTEEIATYVLLEDDGKQVTYMGVFDEKGSVRSVQKQILTALQARNLLYEKHIDSELFYPGELDKWKGSILCYGFGYDDGDKYRYAWVNSATGEVEFADEVEDYMGMGEG